MSQFPVVPEPDVLVHTALALISRGAFPYQFSVASGRGIDTRSTENRISRAFDAIGRTPIFASNGPDILAVSDLEWWQIECKGYGTGKSSTHRNNFDRAVASTVSYYTQSPPSELNGRRPHLGLALPAAPDYLRHLTTRFGNELRFALNIWTFLYMPEDQSVIVVGPDDKF